MGMVRSILSKCCACLAPDSVYTEITFQLLPKPHESVESGQALWTKFKLFFLAVSDAGSAVEGLSLIGFELT